MSEVIQARLKLPQVLLEEYLAPKMKDRAKGAIMIAAPALMPKKLKEQPIEWGKEQFKKQKGTLPGLRAKQPLRLKNIGKFFAAHKKGVMIGAAIAAVAAAGGILLHKRKDKTTKLEKKKLNKLNYAFKTYLLAAADGELGYDSLSSILTRLAAYTCEKHNMAIPFPIDPIVFAELLKNIQSYTQQLAKEHGYRKRIKSAKIKIGKELLLLQTYLELQKQILFP